MDRSIKLFGTTQAAPERMTLRAGPVTVEFEAGGLRYIRHGGTEAVRAIAFLIRDKVWGTANPRIVNLKVQSQAQQFRLSFDAECRTNEGEITWSGEVTGATDGSITFVGVARPATDFETGRTGFVVLHPVDLVAGRAVTVTDADGRTRDSEFPPDIDPSICFTNIRRLRYEVMPGLHAVCRMEGSVPWEMEDQRNWTDASFKTYVRPLSLPNPYVVRGGSEDRQKICLSFEGGVATEGAAASDRPVTVFLGATTGTAMPAIGISAPLRWLHRALDVAPIVRDLGAKFLHARFDLSRGHGQAQLLAVRDIAKATGTALLIEITVSSGGEPETELNAVAKLLDDVRVTPTAYIVVPALALLALDPTVPGHSHEVERIYSAARKVFAGKLLGGGVFGFFAELNRNRPPPDKIDFLMSMSSALVHAPDDESVMETLDAIAHLARSAKRIGAGKPYWLGPSAIGMDESPNGPTADNPDNARVAIARMDPRHRGLFGAAFTMGLIAEAARSGIATVITAAPVGELGVAYARTDYPQPGYDDHAGALVYPLFHVLRGLARAQGKPRVEATSEAPRCVRAVAYQDNGSTVLWLANVTNREQRVTVEGASGAHLWRLDEELFEAATADPRFLEREAWAAEPTLALAPYAVVCLHPGA